MQILGTCRLAPVFYKSIGGWIGDGMYDTNEQFELIMATAIKQARKFLP